MADLIEELKENVEQEKRLHNWDVAQGLERAINLIKSHLKNNIERHAHWIIKENAIEKFYCYVDGEEFYCYVDGYVCSDCFKMTDNEYDYCPHCGCEMNGGTGMTVKKQLEELNNEL